MYSRGIQIFLALVLFSLPIANSANGAELDLDELIAGIKKSISAAQKKAEPPYAKIPWIEAEISYVLKKEAEGQFKAYVVTVGGKYATETIHRTKVRIEPIGEWRVQAPDDPRVYGFAAVSFAPYAHRGEIREATIAAVDHRVKKIFVRPAGKFQGYAIPFSYGAHTKLIDVAGHTKSIKDLRAGTSARLFYNASAEGQKNIDLVILTGWEKGSAPPN